MGSNENYINFNTNQEKKAKIPGKPRILVAPLDWGLGHSTRCIPIVHDLLSQDCEVWLAGEGPIEKVLKAEFPQLPFLPLKGYNISYSKSGIWLTISILKQVPKILSAIRYENKWLRNTVKQQHFDAIISDNRYGLYHKKIPSVFITHQLTIKSFLGKWAENLLLKANYRFIRRFSECWIPDNVGKNSLAGDLSHPPKKLPIPVYYLGPISRFKKSGIKEKKKSLVIILSGPEPQRSIFENLLINQLVHYNGTADFFRGLPLTETILPSTNQLRFYNHMPAGELNKKIEAAEIVISRSGYTTVMDLVQLQKKCILVPTPGQTEQEYLAKHLMKNGIAFCVKQEGFLLQNELEAAKKFNYTFPVAGGNNLKETIRRFISWLS